jgi:hypothetical protein
MEELIESFELLPTPPNTHVKVTCAMVSFKNHVRLNFGNVSRSNKFEMHFIRHLTEAGIPVKVLK